MTSSIIRNDVTSPHFANPVPYAVLMPDCDQPLPLCLLLFGAGGTRESLCDLKPLFEGWWSENAVAPMRIVALSAGNDYYLHWDQFLAEELLPRFGAATTYLAGISGGGYGSLKLAFEYPGRFAAVAAMQPMLEPGLEESDVGARNRLHHSAGGPPELIGPHRDRAVWQAHNPANRARANAAAIRSSGMAIYLDAADCDFLNAHDGAEFLHRTLWDLDIAHEYHLVRGADHGGPTMRPRLRAMFSWLGSLARGPVVDHAAEEAASRWLAGGMQGPAPAGATATNAFVAFLRARFEPLRRQAAECDPNTPRRYGRISQ